MANTSGVINTHQELLDKPIELMADGKSGDKLLETRVALFMKEYFELWKQRHAKYGRGNIAEFGAVGCLIRASDKKARLREYYLGNSLHKENIFNDESVDDSWKDLFGYALIGLLCHRGLWPGVNNAD